MASDNLELGFFRRQRVRLLRQSELTECGLACLAMIANYWGGDTDLVTLRRRVDLSQRGTSLRALLDASYRIGLVPRAVSLDLNSLKNLFLPAILHWDQRHYVVVERVHRDKALIHNPDGVTRWIPFSKLSMHFTGVAVELRPASALVKEPKRERLKLGQLWTAIHGLLPALTQAVFLAVALQAVALALPYYLQLAIDTALPALDKELLLVVGLGFIMLSVMNAAITLLRAFILLNVGTTVAYGLKINLVRHLFWLPIAWYQKRETGDILSRFQSIGPLQKFLTEGALASVLDGGQALIMLGAMLYFSTMLGALALASVVMIGAVRLAFYRRRRDAQEQSIVAAGKEQTSILETLRGIAAVRLFSKEGLRHALWQSRLTDATNADVVIGRINIWQDSIILAIGGIENVLSIWVGVSLVIENRFSVGLLFAYFAYKQRFAQSTALFTEQFLAFRLLRLHLDRLSDIVHTPEENSVFAPSPASVDANWGIELRGVRYRYSESDPFVLSDATIAVTTGEHIAITGPSGGGKSTLVKVLAGLLEPESGSFTVGGVPLKQFGVRNFQHSVATVMQDDSLFVGSLSDNISFFDPDVSLERVEKAARAAAVHDDVCQMPLKYETLVGDMGSTLSGGQKQRILLARALYREPKILISDEGTSHLDAAKERLVNETISQLGITCIVVAHRRESIEAAERVYVLRDGRLSISAFSIADFAERDLASRV